MEIQNHILLDTDMLLAQDGFNERVRRAEATLAAYKSGKLAVDDVSGEKPKNASQMLLDLLAIVAWLRVQQAYFNEWPEQPSGARYIQVENYVKELMSLVDTEECVDLISHIALHKAGGDEEKAKKVIGVCTRIVDDELLRSGYVYKISRNEEE